MSERLIILHGCALAELRTLPAESVQCCVTSPPYWGLRDYGVAGQLGLEATPALYVEKMVTVFEEVRRVLKRDGTLWMNLGDSYAGGGGFCATAPSTATSKSGKYGTSGAAMKSVGTVEGLKAKDLVGIPWRVAFALQAAGWWLRSEIIWHKPNPMPESVTDRPTKSHETLFLLTKSVRYYYDAEAIMEPVSETGCGNRKEFRGGGSYTNNNSFDNNAVIPNRTPGNVSRKSRDNFRRGTGKYAEKGSSTPGQSGRHRAGAESSYSLVKRNKRSVWTVPSAPYRDAHFATFPPDLIKPCILAGSRPGDVVLDPFLGSGTTAQVALELGRRALGIEINAEYVKLCEQRCHVTPGLGL